MNKTTELESYNLYINGAWVRSESGRRTSVENPATGETLAYVTDADEADVKKALESAESAGKTWQNISPLKRREYLERLMALLKAEKEHFAGLLTSEQGKTYADALAEVDDTVAYLRNAAEYAPRIKGDILPLADPQKRLMIEKVPYGVVVALCAWNYPLALAGRKLGPALIAGNTVVIKPHELTPLATVEFMRLVDKAGFPPGTVNLITGNGPETGRLLVESPLSKLITVTGSVGAGQAIYRSAAPNIAGLVLELGGKAPFIVLEDADIDRAVDAAVTSRYANCGQVCICCDMVFVHEAVKKEFTDKLLKKVSAIRVGDPMNPKTDMGPKVSRADLDKIDRIVKTTLSEGAVLAAGGAPLEGGEYDKGYYYPPTVLTEVTPPMTAAREEIFGPVLPILTIESYEQAVEMTNAGPYGLAAYLFTANHSIIMNAARHLEVGTVFLNQGITGAFHGFHNGHKLSGTSGEDGEYGIEAYLQKRTTYMDTSLIY